MKVAVPWLILLSAATSSLADEPPPEFEAHTFAAHGGAKMPYRLLKPAKIEAGKKYPLVLVLHGWGERGTDNKKQLKDFDAVFQKPDARRRFPCFVLLPQANGSWVQHAVFDKPIALTKSPAASLAMANEILKSVLKKHPVDENRLYLTGFSNGACGVWELLEREPRVWAFHGAKDKTIPLDRMKEMVGALRSASAHPIFTIVPNGAHYDAKLAALHDRNFVPWMFAQRRGSPEVPFEQVARSKDKRPTSLETKK